MDTYKTARKSSLRDNLVSANEDQLLEAIEYYRMSLDLQFSSEAFSNLVYGKRRVCNWSLFDDHFETLRQVE